MIKALLKDGSFILVSKVLSAMLILFANLIIAKFYGDESVGRLGLLTASLAILGTIVSIGMGTSLIKLLSELKAERDFNKSYILYKKSQSVLLLATVILLLLLFLGYRIYPNFFWNILDDELLLFISGILFLFSLNNLNLSSFRVIFSAKFFSLVQLLHPLSFVLFIIIFALTEIGGLGYIWAYTVAIILAVIVTTWLLNARLKKLVKVSINTHYDVSYPKLINTSLPMFITGIMAVLAGQVDILMIGAFLSPDKVGHYVIAVKVGLFSSFVLTALNILIAPKFAALHYEEKYDGLRKFGQKSATLVTFMTAPVFILVIFKGRELLGMFGLEFQTAYSSLVILVLTQALNILFGSTAYFMNMTGNSKVLNKVIVISTLTNVLLNILLIPVFGIDGAAFSSLVSTVLWNVVLTVFIHRKYGFFIGFNPFLLFKL